MFCPWYWTKSTVINTKVAQVINQTISQGINWILSQNKSKISWRFYCLEKSLRNRANEWVPGDMKSLEVFKKYDHVLKLKSHRMFREESIAIVGERQEDSQAGVGFPNHCTAWPQIQISYSFPLSVYRVLWWSTMFMFLLNSYIFWKVLFDLISMGEDWNACVSWFADATAVANSTI